MLKTDCCRRIGTATFARIVPSLASEKKGPGFRCTLSGLRLLTIALKISHRLYVMGHGRIVFEGTVSEFNADAKVRQDWLEG